MAYWKNYRARKENGRIRGIVISQGPADSRTVTMMSDVFDSMTGELLANPVVEVISISELVSIKKRVANENRDLAALITDVELAITAFNEAESAKRTAMEAQDLNTLNELVKGE